MEMEVDPSLKVAGCIVLMVIELCKDAYPSLSRIVTRRPIVLMFGK